MKEKNRFRNFAHAKYHKALRIIKISTFMLFIGILTISAENILSQQTEVSISLKNATLKKVISEIEKSSAYVFLITDEAREELNRKTDIETNKESINSVLDDILKNTNLKYSITGRQVSIYKSTNAKEKTTEKLEVTEPVQQKRRVTGNVVDEKGETVIGANIIEVGTTNGTVTDIDGNFVLEVENNATIKVTYIGYLEQEVATSNQASFNIKLVEDNQALDELVVVGYGVMRKKDLTGSVAQLGNDSFKDLTVSHATEAMAGKLAGVQIQQVGGQPGQSATIRVRGAGSITASSSPLYVVDGYPLGVQNLNMINPNDIESIEVLKDASAAAIYGSRAANGVVLITTKSGKEGGTRVSLDMSWGMQDVTRRMDLMDAQEFSEFSREAFNNNYLDHFPNASANDPVSGRPTGYRYRYPSVYDDSSFMESVGSGTDWQNEIFRTSPLQNYQLTVSGGNEKSKFLFSLGYYDQEGIIINSNYKRYSARAKIDSQINSWLKAGINIAPSYNNSNKSIQGHWASDGVVNSALATSPIVPVRNKDNTWASQSMYAVASDGLTGVPNAVALTHIRDFDTNLSLFTNGYVELKPLKNLIVKSTIGADIREYRNEYFRPSTIPNNGNIAPLPSTERRARETSYESLNWLNENTVTYLGSWDKHELDILGGITAQKNVYRYTQATGSDFPNDKIQTINNATVKSSTSSRSSWTLLSYLARINYRYNDKYYFTGSIRADGSSRFGSNNRYGYFPSASVAWRISQEDFMKDIDWMTDFKIRSSYGITGNNNIGDYAAIGIMQNANYVLGSNSGNIVNGASKRSFSNQNLTWEKTRQADIGIDMSAFNNRLSFSFDFYNRLTTDLLMNVDIPTITGFSNAMQNIGKMQNNGAEITISGVPFNSKNFGWNISSNLSVNKNKVLALGPTGDPVFGDGGAGTTHITMIGKPIGSFYGYKAIGVFMTEDELKNYPHFSDTQVGDMRFEDVNGDNKIDADDRTIIGNNMPDFTWGLTNSFNFGAFDANFSLQGVVGNEVLHLGRRFYTQGEGNQNQLREMLNRWQSIENPGNGQIPRANSQPTGQNNAISTRWVEDGSFLRLNNLSIGYSLNTSLLNKLSLQQARIYITAQNLFTITNYSGFNPETSFREDNATAPGTDYGMYPLSRTYTLGINLTF